MNLTSHETEGLSRSSAFNNFYMKNFPITQSSKPELSTQQIYQLLLNQWNSLTSDERQMYQTDNSYEKNKHTEMSLAFNLGKGEEQVPFPGSLLSDTQSGEVVNGCIEYLSWLGHEILVQASTSHNKTYEDLCNLHKPVPLGPVLESEVSSVAPRIAREIEAVSKKSSK